MSKRKYTKLIEDFCKRQGIAVPPGFYRRAACPLAVIRTDSSPPKLVAMTWFKKEDVVYYIEHMVMAESGENTQPPVRIFDFKAQEEVEYTGGKRLRKKRDLGVNP